MAENQKQETRLRPELQWMSERNIGQHGIRPNYARGAESEWGGVGATDYEQFTSDSSQKKSEGVLSGPIGRAGKFVLAAILFPFRFVVAVFFLCLHDARVGLPAVALAAFAVLYYGPAIDTSFLNPVNPFARSGGQPVVLGEAPAVATPDVAEQAVTPSYISVYNTGGTGVNLRSSPGGAELEIIPEGTRLEVIGTDVSHENKAWKHVRTASGKVGYVAAEYTQPAP